MLSKMLEVFLREVFAIDKRIFFNKLKVHTHNFWWWVFFKFLSVVLFFVYYLSLRERLWSFLNAHEHDYYSASNNHIMREQNMANMPDIGLGLSDTARVIRGAKIKFKTSRTRFFLIQQKAKWQLPVMGRVYDEPNLIVKAKKIRKLIHPDFFGMPMLYFHNSDMMEGEHLPYKRFLWFEGGIDYDYINSCKLVGLRYANMRSLLLDMKERVLDRYLLGEDMLPFKANNIYDEIDRAKWWFEDWYNYRRADRMCKEFLERYTQFAEILQNIRDKPQLERTGLETHYMRIMAEYEREYSRVIAYMLDYQLDPKFFPYTRNEGSWLPWLKKRPTKLLSPWDPEEWLGKEEWNKGKLAYDRLGNYIPKYEPNLDFIVGRLISGYEISSNERRLVIEEGYAELINLVNCDGFIQPHPTEVQLQ